MRFEFDLKLGDRVIRMADEAATPAEVFERMAFWDSLPKKGPGGEGDLEFSYRTPKGFEYYAIVCPSAGQEFKFGQLKDEKGQLFPKGWEELRRGADDHHEEEEPQRKPDARGGDAPKAAELDKLAEQLVQRGAVKKDGAAYTVASGNSRHTVSKNQSGAVECSCRRFVDVRKFNKDFACEHIRAVRIATQGASKVA